MWVRFPPAAPNLLGVARLPLLPKALRGLKIVLTLTGSPDIYTIMISGSRDPDPQSGIGRSPPAASIEFN